MTEVRNTCRHPAIAAWTGLLVAACTAFGAQIVRPTPGHAQARTGADRTAGNQGPGPSLAAFHHDSALFTVLMMEPGPVQFDSLRAYESRLGFEVTDTLVEIAEDTAQHPYLRATSVLLIGRRHDLADLIILRPLLGADDPRIRLAVTAAAQEYLPVREASALTILSAALEDGDEAVQARALEGITDRDPALLRRYLAKGPSPGLAAVARGLIAAAEERGAALVADEAGTLRRSTPDGQVLEYRSTTAWESHDLSVGTLTLRTADGRQLTVGDSIEVARNVVPAFFSSDGKYLVFEQSRIIHVLDIGTGSTRALGPGVAPRVLPFSDDFVFARAAAGGAETARTQTALKYELRMASFADSTDSSTVIGEINAELSYAVSGGASPVRWMRVSEITGSFRLTGEGIDSVALPDPFDGSRGGN